MEDRVTLHGGRQVQLISMTRYFLSYLKPSKSLKVEFAGGSGGLDVLVQEPNFIPYLV